MELRTDSGKKAGARQRRIPHSTRSR